MTDITQTALDLLGKPSFTQNTRLFRLTTSLGANKLLVERIEGQEGISQPLHFDITVLCTDAHLDLNSLLGQPALLQILTQQSRTDLRPIHAHITAFSLLSSDGGFARYSLTLHPWTAFLRYRTDSYVWQDKTTLDIVTEIFADYQGQGKLAPAWRIAVTDVSHYTARDVCTQFEESDWSFVERLLAEEGLFYWFEHTGDTHSNSYGAHTLVISDNNAAFTPNTQKQIRYHRANATEKTDSITRWHAKRQLVTNTLSVSSWNETQVSIVSNQQDTSHNNGDAPNLSSTDFPGARRFGTRAQVERTAQIQLEAMEARNKTYAGNSTVRTLAPGTTFTLTGHAIHDLDRKIDGKESAGQDGATYAIISVRHQGRNNLASDVGTLAKKAWGNSIANIAGNKAEERNKAEPEEPLYSNEFTALRTDIPWRAMLSNGHGALLHPKPTAHGIHTAIVVGAAGADVTTERNHQIKIQMPWQRGAQSSSRNAHPQGTDNAPGNESAYIWVRVAETSAGANWGSSFVPRIGQEVILDYVEGDIDRPIVIGTLYNGKGQDDAQGNQIAQGAGAATGNAPAWFAGSEGDHAHNAILAGFKTQEIGNSSDGQGGYNALVLDDSKNQVGARLQTTKNKTQLNLGHIKRQTDNQRQQSHGHGAELTTDAYGALRAGLGMLLSADNRQNAGSSQMDAKEAHGQLQQAHELQKSFADTAAKHNAFVGKTQNKDQHDSPEKNLARPIASLNQTEQGTGSSEGGGAGTVTAFGRPDLVASAPGGISLLTPQDMHATAAAITITGGQDVSSTVGSNYVAAVRSGISLFTYGDAKVKRSDKGIRMHAAHGKFDMQAQSAELKAAADKDVTLSSNAKVEIAGKEHVLLTAGSAYIKISGGSIQIHAPGVVQFKASQKVLGGAASMSYAMPPRMPLTPDWPDVFSQKINVAEFIGINTETGNVHAHVPYSVRDKQGTIIAQGITTSSGETQRIYTKQKENADLYLGEGDWRVFVEVKHELPAHGNDEQSDDGEQA